MKTELEKRQVIFNKISIRFKSMLERFEKDVQRVIADEIARACYIPKYVTDDPKKQQEIRDRQKRERKDCSHLKGGRPKSGLIKDYCVSLHTFIDGRKRIRCLLCGFTVWNNEPGWAEALKMVKKSSNSPTSSESVHYRVRFSNGSIKDCTEKEVDELFDWRKHAKGNTLDQPLVTFFDKIGDQDGQKSSN
jgi:hypothetical protein